MRAQNAFLLAFGACSVGFLAAWLLFRSSRDEALDGVHAATEARLQELEHLASRTDSQPPDLEMPDSRVPASTAPPEVPPSAPPTPTKDPVQPTDPPDFSKLPEGTLAEMEAKREAINAQLVERSTPFLLQRLDDGLVEKVADGETYSRTGVSEFERTTIYALRAEPGRGWFRTALPRGQYPELYVFKDEVARLDLAIEARKIADAREATAKSK
jgi:hypothetical protein